MDLGDASGPARQSVCVLHQPFRRDKDRDRRAMSLTASKCQLATMKLNQMKRYWKAKPGAVVIPRQGTFDLTERLQSRHHFLLGHAYAGIGTANTKPFASSKNTVNVTLPSSVNFIAFESRLSMTCFKRSGSTRNTGKHNGISV